MMVFVVAVGTARTQILSKRITAFQKEENKIITRANFLRCAMK
jgi:hypothetical protein